MKKLLTSVLILLFTSVAGLAQQSSVVLLEQSSMQISGTSTIHDWTCDVESMQADIRFDAAAFEGDEKNSPVQSFTLIVPVDKIESGKGRMNKKIYGALKEKDHPTITFKLSSAELADAMAAKEAFRLNAKGSLTVAGNSRDISFPVDAALQSDGTYTFTGSYEINMKDYDVDPPSAMLGAIKSGEEVTITFELFVKAQ